VPFIDSSIDSPIHPASVCLSANELVSQVPSLNLQPSTFNAGTRKYKQRSKQTIFLFIDNNFMTDDELRSSFLGKVGRYLDLLFEIKQLGRLLIVPPSLHV
jgi:hypothetical protein